MDIDKLSNHVNIALCDCFPWHIFFSIFFASHRSRNFVYTPSIPTNTTIAYLYYYSMYPHISYVPKKRDCLRPWLLSLLLLLLLSLLSANYILFEINIFIFLNKAYYSYRRDNKKFYDGLAPSLSLFFVVLVWLNGELFFF